VFWKVLPAKFAVPISEEQRAEEGTSSGKGAIRRLPPAKDGPSPGHLYPQPAAFGSSPGIAIRQQPWRFLGLMLAAGFAGGALFKIKSLRTGLRLYSALRKL
jgi:hypothetical protein